MEPYSADNVGIVTDWICHWRKSLLSVQVLYAVIAMLLINVKIHIIYSHLLFFYLMLIWIWGSKAYTPRTLYGQDQCACVKPTRYGDQHIEPLQHIHLQEPPPGDQVVDFSLSASVEQHETVLCPHQ